jgi:hypothetical protein
MLGVTICWDELRYSIGKIIHPDSLLGVFAQTPEKVYFRNFWTRMNRVKMIAGFVPVSKLILLYL